MSNRHATHILHASEKRGLKKLRKKRQIQADRLFQLPPALVIFFETIGKPVMLNVPTFTDSWQRQAIYLGGGAMEQLRLFVFGESCGDLFERVPKHRV